MRSILSAEMPDIVVSIAFGAVKAEMEEREFVLVKGTMGSVPEFGMGMEGILVLGRAPL
jgi:hypothetical protein